jgi:hypothetical protein
MDDAPIEYLPYGTPTREKPLPWQARGIRQTASGYGRRLTLATQALHDGRWYRVYAMCMSNAATCWIETEGRRLYLHDG